MATSEAAHRRGSGGSGGDPANAALATGTVETTSQLEAAAAVIQPPSTSGALCVFAVLPLLLLVLPGLTGEVVHFAADAHRRWRRGDLVVGWMMPPWSSPSSSPENGGAAPASSPVTKPTTVGGEEGGERLGAGAGAGDDVVEKFDVSGQKRSQSQSGQKKKKKKQTPQKKRRQQSSGPDGGDDQKAQIDAVIASLRTAFEEDPGDPFKAISLAEALRQRDLTYHDGGSVQFDAIETYKTALSILSDRRLKIVDDAGGDEDAAGKVPGGAAADLEAAGGDEFFLDYRSKSVDGLISATWSNLAKMYFMANMFEDSVDAYDSALEYKPNDMDALNGRASSYIILGRYEDAAADYLDVLRLDKTNLFADAFTGLAKVLTANETAVPGGWDVLARVLDGVIPTFYGKLDGFEDPSLRASITEKLKRAHLAMFQYHDVKTKNTDLAWEHLTKGLRHKMALVAPFNAELEKLRVETVKGIFHEGFWPQGIGSDSKLPIFVIGFVRSGSTLLERILDAHPLIVGTGEDSIFNGRLGTIRDGIVRAAAMGLDELQSVVQSLADGVDTAMVERWRTISERGADEGTTSDADAAGPRPKRFVDKMLTNYMNVGFIHMLFPNALILHVAREPMDTLFSAYKHDFPPGNLDYLSEFPSLAQIYEGYRGMMEHWDEVLPGRVTHIRYEDLVHDTPGVAKAVIRATGLKWDPDVLKFHEKKQAVNTLSTHQVRKGIYKHSIEYWKKYESQLQPLAQLVGSRVSYPLRTSLPGYKRSD